MGRGEKPKGASAGAAAVVGRSGAGWAGFRVSGRKKPRIWWEPELPGVFLEVIG